MATLIDVMNEAITGKKGIHKQNNHVYEFDNITSPIDSAGCIRISAFDRTIGQYVFLDLSQLRYIELEDSQ